MQTLDKRAMQPQNRSQAAFSALTDLMLTIPPAEHAIALAVFHQTLARGAEWAVIPMTQFQRLTGMAEEDVAAGIQAALERGIITREPMGRTQVYALTVA